MRTILGHRGYDVFDMEEEIGAQLMGVLLMQLAVLQLRIVLGQLADGVRVMEGGSEIRDKK